MHISFLSVHQRLLFLLALVLVWPALLNGAPFLFSDTTGYIRAADAVVFKATGHASVWSDVIAGSGAPAAEPGQRAGASSFTKNVIVGRSIVYGLILYLGVLCGSLAVPVVVQAALAGAVVIGGARHFADPGNDSGREPRAFVRLAGAAIGVAAITALPWFAGFLMPDIFAGLAIFAAVIVLTGWAREPLAWRLFWAGVLCLAALVHSSHVLLLVGLGVAGLLLRLLRGPVVRLVPIAVVFAAAGVGVAGDAAFQLGIGAALHRPTVRPPFLAVRLIADGPGAAYLRDTCPASGFALCAFRDVPRSNSDVLLWSADPRLGMFTAASAEQQRRIAGEQVRFVAAVARRYPGWTLQTALGNYGAQLGLLGLREFRTSPLADPAVAGRIPEPVRTTIRASAAARGTLPTGWYGVLVWPVTLFGLGVLLAAAWRGGSRVAVTAGLLLFGILLNAGICGMLSIPSDRYQDRVIWLVAVFAVFAWRDAGLARTFSTRRPV